MAKERRGFWSKVFKKPDKQLTYSLEDILGGVTPIYSNGFGDNIYASDVVQQAIYSIVSELKKLDVVHVRKASGTNDFVSVEGAVQRILDAPNPLMTTTDFIEKVAWTLLLNYNAFVYPVFEGNTLKGLYPLQPSLVEFDNDYLGSGKTWVRFHFPNGFKGDVPYEDIIHLRYRYSVSEFMGGNANGQPDYQPLLETLRLNDSLLKGLAKSLKLQTSINGWVKLKTMHNYDEQVKKAKEFEQKIIANEAGIGVLDIEGDYIPVQKQIQLLDATTLEFIDKKILRFFGVSIPIVDGNYTKEQYEAFYQKTIEPLVKTFAQAFTKGIFSRHESQGYKNQIAFYVKELIFMNTDQKLNLFKDLSAQGGVYINEYRTAFGMRPINDLQGVRMQSLNYVDSKYAQQYQTGQNAKTDENNGSHEGAENEENTDENGGVENEQ